MAGSVTTNVAPGPGSTLTVPWWAVTMAATMASPSPAPPDLRERDGIGPVERLEDAARLGRVDARPVVMDGEDGRVALEPDAHLDSRSRRRCGAGR